MAHSNGADGTNAGGPDLLSGIYQQDFTEEQ